MLAPVLSAIQDVDFAPPALDQSVATVAAEEADAEREQNSLLVLNEDRGVVHRAVVVDLDLPDAQATAACGWCYGTARRAKVISADEPPPGHKALCGRCLPRWRYLRKRIGHDGGGA